MTPLETVRIASEDGATQATFAPSAGMVCCSLQHHERELLDLGQGLEAYAERGKTMGIPLLYPWANRLADFGYDAADRRVALPHDPAEIPPDENGLPIHGVVPRLMRWTASAVGATVSAELDWSSLELMRLFPFKHRVQMEATVAPGSLTITTVVHASGGDAVPVSFGFHPYLRLPGGDRAQIEVELPACERLLTDELSIPTGVQESLGPTRFALAGTSWDDGMVVTEAPARFSASASAGAGAGPSAGADAGAGAPVIVLELLEHYGYAQIYAPPERDYICFEPMTAPTNALRSGAGLTVLRAGEEYSAVFRITAGER